MATLNDWNSYVNLLHEMALIEDDLRANALPRMRHNSFEEGKGDLARLVLFERFGVDV